MPPIRPPFEALWWALAIKNGTNPNVDLLHVPIRLLSTPKVYLESLMCSPL